jgi:hypothetical protein
MPSRHVPAHLCQRGRLPGPRSWLAIASIAAVLVLALTGVAAAVAFAPRGSAHRSAAHQATARTASHASRSRHTATTPRHAAAKSAAVAAAPARAAAPRTSCTSVAHVGDSTSVDLISAAYLPNPAQRLAARYAAVGVRHLKVDASGGRSIVETLPGQVNGYNVAEAWWHAGYRGCWVFALGTNDTANIAAGSAVGMMARIQRMMSVAHGEPVLWVNTRTQVTSGPWSSANEKLWDDTLLRALALYPNMRVFNWAGVAQPGWFLPDGIHYNSAGCAARARAIADALARAFPSGAHSHSRVVT